MQPCACGCGTPVGPDARGRPRRYVRGHNARGHGRPRMTDEQQHEAVLQRVVRGPGCWLWTGATRISVTSAGNQDRRPVYRGRYAYRRVWEIEVGPCPARLEPDHLCRNSMCVRPDHLDWVTHRENVRRGEKIGAQIARTHCPRGHVYSGHNLIVRRGKRECRRCVYERNARNRVRRQQR